VKVTVWKDILPGEAIMKVLKPCKFTLLFAALSAAALAQPPNIWTYTDNSAYGYFYSSDPADSSGCVTLEAYVLASSGGRSFPGRPTQPVLWMGTTLTQTDNCTGVVLKSFYEVNPDVTQFIVSESKATLKAQGYLYDQASNSMQWVVIDLTWSPMGPPTKTSSTSHYKAPDGNAVFLNTQISRLAYMTGSISVEGVNFTPEKSVGANYFMITQKNVGP
jgi:hypothetical protein